jgi:hypothetical protein
MNLAASFPTWLPWWVPLAVLIPLSLYALLFLLMPFSVFGVKGRLEGVEARLDEIQGEIRSLALRLPELERYERDPRAIEQPPRRWADDDRPPIPPAARPRRPVEDRPAPIRRAAEYNDRAPAPPPPYERERLADDRPPPPPTRRVDPTRVGREEPRLGPR